MDFNKKISCKCFFHGPVQLLPINMDRTYKNRKYKNKINRLHERCLRLIYYDKPSTFANLLEKDNSVSINHKNLQVIAIEMFKVYIKTSPKIMQKIFLVKEQWNYNLRNQANFEILQVKRVNYGLESIQVLGSKTWKSLPNDLKRIDW